jgi:hypothetical protein
VRRAKGCPARVLQADMKNELLASLRRLSDRELVGGLKGLVARERHATAQIVAHLAELDTRDVYLREGYPSLFAYCRDVLSLSESEAFNRIDVARAARRFPVIMDLLLSDAIHLTTVRLLSPHLTEENHREALESACGKKKAEVLEIVARLAPRPDVPTTLTPISDAGGDRAPAVASPQETLSFRPVTGVHTPAPAANVTPAVAATPNPPTGRSATPLSPDRYRLQLTISGATVEKLRLAKDMLGHAIPSGDEAAILDRALTLLVEDLARKKFGETSAPRPSRGGKPHTRHIAAAVKRAVWMRDLGRCAFASKTGHRCEERRFVEFHHVDPYALGGEASADLISLRCRRHNDYEGRLYFGPRRTTQEMATGEAHSFRNESHRAAAVLE